MLIPTSREAWEALEGSFASQSTARVMAIRNEMSKVKKHDYPNADAFFNKVKSLADVLSSIGQPLRPAEFNAFHLAGLDRDYDSLADRISARSMLDPMPIRDIYAQLLNIKQRVEACRTELSIDIHPLPVSPRWGTHSYIPALTSDAACSVDHPGSACPGMDLLRRLLPRVARVVVATRMDRAVVAALNLYAKYAPKSAMSHPVDNEISERFSGSWQ
jgi:hypothetical protein